MEERILIVKEQKTNISDKLIIEEKLEVITEQEREINSPDVVEVIHEERKNVSAEIIIEEKIETIKEQKLDTLIEIREIQ